MTQRTDRVAQRAGMLLMLLCLTGCTARIAGGSAPVAPPHPDAGGGIPPAADCTARSVGAAPIRRLTRVQYDNTIRDLLGDTSNYAQNTFAPDVDEFGFDNNAQGQSVDSLLSQQYLDAAMTLSTNAVTNRFSAVVGCSATTSSAQQAACASQFITTFGKRAFRRPLTTDEASRFNAFYASARAGGKTFPQAIQLTLAALLVSPEFIYFPEFGAGSPPAGTTLVPLSPYELASRLSYFLWNSTPDDSLLAAADASALSTPAQVEAQARRLMQDPRAHQAVANFHYQYLNLKALLTVPKDPALVPTFTADIRAAMATEAETFMDATFWQTGTLDALFTSPTSYLNAGLASFYGLPAVAGTAFVKVDLDPAKYSGFLTQGALMTMLSSPDESSPIFRGKFVRERLLCTGLPPPPDTIPQIPPPAPGVSNRDRFSQHASDPACSGCHSLMDPIGFGFEHFDEVGRWRDMDGVFSVDATGNVNATHDMGAGAFNGVADLGAKLNQSSQVTDCVLTNWFQYAVARGQATEDVCSLASVKQRFLASHRDMREMLVGLTLTDAFLYRTPVVP